MGSTLFTTFDIKTKEREKKTQNAMTSLYLSMVIQQPYLGLVGKLSDIRDDFTSLSNGRANVISDWYSTCGWTANHVYRYVTIIYSPIISISAPKIRSIR